MYIGKPDIEKVHALNRIRKIKDFALSITKDAESEEISEEKFVEILKTARSLEISISELEKMTTYSVSTLNMWLKKTKTPTASTRLQATRLLLKGITSKQLSD